jgi:hypothetical protein
MSCLLQVSELDHQIHVIEVPCTLEPSVIQQKPPDYDTVADAPPCYEDAIKLSPSLLLASPTSGTSCHDQSQPSTPSTSATSSASLNATCVENSSEIGVEGNSKPSSNMGSCSGQTISRLEPSTVGRYGVPGTPPPPYAATR